VHNKTPEGKLFLDSVGILLDEWLRLAQNRKIVDIPGRRNIRRTLEVDGLMAVPNTGGVGDAGKLDCITKASLTKMEGPTPTHGKHCKAR